MLFNWRVYLTFSGLGPPIGASIWILVIAGCSQNPEVLKLFFLALIISWFDGFIPAALTGLILPILWRRMSRAKASASHRAFSAAVVGALCTSSYILVLFSYEWSNASMMAATDEWSYASMMAATGAISAGICGLIVREDWLHAEPRRKRPMRATTF
jgi:hypothetical protein